MAVVIPPHNSQAGDPGHPGLHNNIADVLSLYGQALAQLAGLPSGPGPDSSLITAIQALTTATPGYASLLPAVTTAAYGADATGANDSSVAIQNAMNATPAGALLYTGPGTYKCGTTLSMPPGLRWWGAGSNQGAATATKISSTASPAVTFTAADVRGNEIAFMDIESSGDVLGPQFASNSYFHDMVLRVTANSGSCVNVNGACVNTSFGRIYFANAAPGTRTVPLVSMTSVSSSALSNIVHYKCLFASGGAQYCVYMACTGAAGSHTADTFRDCFFEQPTGGAIKSLSGQSFFVENCYFWDLATSAAVTNSLIYIGTFAGAQVSEGTQIINCGRNLTPAGGLGIGGPWDIQLESTVTDTLISGYHVKNAANTENDCWFNLAAAQNVTLINNQFPATGGSGVGNSASKTVLVSPSLTATKLISGGIAWPDEANSQQPAGCIAATHARALATSAQGTLTSGTLYVRQIWIPPGLTISNMTMMVNTTAKTGGTNGWYVLLDSTRHVVAVTADQNDAATTWGTPSAAQTLAFVTPYVTAGTGQYYIGVMIAASGMPTFSGQSGMAAGFGGTLTLCGSSSTGQTTPPALTTQMAAFSGTGNYLFYAYLT